MINEDSCQVYVAGFSFHKKPFYTSTLDVDGINTYLMRFQTDGRCRARYDGQLGLIETGDLLLYSPSEPYELKIDKELNSLGELTIESGDYHIFFGGPWIDKWWKSQVRPTRMKLPLNEGFLILFRQIALEQRRMENPYPEISGYYMKILCLELDRQLKEQPTTTHKSYLAYQIKHYIEENASHMFKLDDVASHVGISVSRAVHLFKETFDTSIMQYTIDVKLDMARERIIFSPMSLENVAETSGFANYTYFYRVFRARFGMSPKQFRIANREQLK
ncbi:AraC family transcriptional regulator [Paenibacillus macquariensis]|uniref:AraC family transcriptional regulator, arabinose operon regulatory protein n=1 Tax=Paenibacillus macquariensis TaxID=948756 RepID=A0ABY1JKS2_9BACL|nr:AraC family transcriptional regulator [Paenibacillus macquariensis]MEC0089995.1 AraC family transcriptional regulator [Paenibacillus macquariensis]OAB31120.1 AraC family transcriptional regulator [Paenibacillus macquariensis subsp. macquariensis]SIQ35747.1 AraC family transcriptional regulator, arabinose operon regulatory protein [Paenibacillus macquariensis]